MPDSPSPAVTAKHPLSGSRTGTGLALCVSLLALIGVLVSAAPWLVALGPVEFLKALLAPSDGQFDTLMVHYGWAPRAAMAALIGAGLGLAGTILQQVLRNPLASPTTLGVEAGAQFAIAVTTLYLPGLLAASADLVAVSGGLLAMAVVVAMTARLGFSPISVVLAGMVVTFVLGAGNHALLLFNGEYLGNLFIWGAGSLVQNDWTQFRELWPRVLVLGLALLLLARPLQLLQLGTQSADALGSRTTLIRLLVLALAVAMTATVVSRVGVLGFIGLTAPALARLLGARTLAERLLWSTLMGAALLLAADAVAQQATAWAGGELVPTGIATALVGAPVLLITLRQMKPGRTLPGQSASEQKLVVSGRSFKPAFWTFVGVGLVVLALAMAWSPGLEGWRWTAPSDWLQSWSWRGPRLMGAMAAGVLLGFAGTLVQRLTGNPMASPEVLGITGGASLAIVTVSLLGLNPGRGGQLLAGTLGALLVLGLLFLLSRRHRFSGHQLLLGGVALAVATDATVRLVLSGGDSDAVALLSWISGSTWLISADEAFFLVFLAILLGLVTVCFGRLLTLLPLGETTASALGVSVGLARGSLFLLAALLTAGATLVIGPLSFVGLMAPHLARMLGQQTVTRQLLMAGVIGAVLLLLADYLARVLLFPAQLPTGILATLAGGLYFFWSLVRNGKR